MLLVHGGTLVGFRERRGRRAIWSSARLCSGAPFLAFFARSGAFDSKLDAPTDEKPPLLAQKTREKWGTPSLIQIHYCFATLRA
jgi:hypothetical protein